jgi:CubicO group peptidase (beta-lactamase class C family)
MRSAHARFDDAGTFAGSSYVYATALDYLRFGLLYMRDGVWEGRRLLPEGWIDDGRRVRSYDEPEDRWYGSHWWIVGDDLGTFWASGYDGQSLMMCPPLDLVVVRLGRSPDEHHNPNLKAWRAAMVDAFRP